jgi:glyoxylase-like metal-dependent hydrolase (beta-lactamase superfamily II)
VQFEDVRIDVVEDGRFGLDGGAMFGIIPRPLWSRSDPPDAQNRIEMALRCLLVRRGERVILVDNGLGEQWNDKQRNQFAIDRSVVPGLLANLARLGVAREDVTDVLLTHFHFDHNGGTVQRDGSLTFPNATHHGSRANYEQALAPSPKDAGSFRACDRQGLTVGENLRLYDLPGPLFGGIEGLLSDGHTRGMLLPRIQVGGQTLVYCADLIPTSSHLHAPWVMGYDCHPVTTVEEKVDLLDRAVRDDWILVFEHDPAIDACRIERNERGRYRVSEVVDLGGSGRSWTMP